MYIYTLSFVGIIILINLNPVAASPGRTDKNGGHTCRTNCEQYGLEYGEYHYHNGGSDENVPATDNENQSPSNNQSYNDSDTDNKIEEQQDIIADKDILINEYVDEIEDLEEKVDKCKSEESDLRQKEESVSEREESLSKEEKDLDEELQEIKKEREDFDEKELALTKEIEEQKGLLKQRNNIIIISTITGIGITTFLSLFIVRKIKSRNG